MPKISYAITTHNEDPQYLKTLFGVLLANKAEQDEIVILDDDSTNPGTVSELGKIQNVYKKPFLGDFAEHKNYLNTLCKGDFIFQIDADEMVHPDFVKVLPEIILMNPSVELFTLARINIVSGLTPDDISRWGWTVDDKNRINFPDRQGRIYKNKPEIKWEGKVHERIVGFEAHSDLPDDDDVYCLLHVKDITRQRKQNELYSTL